MTQEIALRIVTGILAVIMRVIRLRAHWQAGSLRDQLRAGREGPWFWVVAVILMSHVVTVDCFVVGIRLAAWAAIDLSMALRWVGAGLWGVADALLWWAHQTLGAN